MLLKTIKIIKTREAEKLSQSEGEPQEKLQLNVMWDPGIEKYHLGKTNEVHIKSGLKLMIVSWFVHWDKCTLVM